jgi:hypothetical protein
MVKVVDAPGRLTPFSTRFLAVTFLPLWVTVALVHDVIFCSPLAKLHVTIQPVPTTVPVFLTLMVAWSPLPLPVVAYVAVHFAGPLCVTAAVG